MSYNTEGCPILRQHGVYYFQTGCAIHLDDVEIKDKAIFDICLTCPKDECVYDRKRKSVVKQLSLC